MMSTKNSSWDIKLWQNSFCSLFIEYFSTNALQDSCRTDGRHWPMGPAMALGVSEAMARAVQSMTGAHSTVLLPHRWCHDRNLSTTIAFPSAYYNGSRLARQIVAIYIISHPPFYHHLTQLNVTISFFPLSRSRLDKIL